MTDYTIIGGGVVGLSLAYGLLRQGRRVTVLDGDDGGYRASRGNFGLVWVQGKGLQQPQYARWSRGSASLWRDFANELSDATNSDSGLRQDGGFDFHFDEAELHQRVKELEGLRDALGGDYPFEVLGHNALKKEEPAIGPKVAGAILCPEDGHVNPLRLLRNLADATRQLGADIRSGVTVETIRPSAGGFRVTTAAGDVVEAGRVILAAGLGNITLGPQLGFAAPVRPQRGQVLITEKLPAGLIRRPSVIARQVDEGAIQIGDSNDESGFDDTEDIATTSRIAARAVTAFPVLSRAKMVRSWGALRVMSPDGLPIYQRSPAHPGAFLVTCHSGITLAAAHARLMPSWFEGATDAPDLEVFREDRFAIPSAA